jgi:hypothetical protein
MLRTRFTYVTDFTAQDSKQSKHGNTMRIYSKLDKFNAFYLLQLFLLGFVCFHNSQHGEVCPNQ